MRRSTMCTHTPLRAGIRRLLVSPELSQRTFDGVRRFLVDWRQRMDSRYLMVSLTPDFAATEIVQSIEDAILRALLESRHIYL